MVQSVFPCGEAHSYILNKQQSSQNKTLQFGQMKRLASKGNQLFMMLQWTLSGVSGVHESQLLLPIFKVRFIFYLTKICHFGLDVTKKGTWEWGKTDS